MGTGISGVILLEFEIELCDKNHFTGYSVKGFFDNYNILKTKDSYYEKYVIKEDILLSNYADFLVEFYTIIHDEFKGIQGPYDEMLDEANTKKILSCKTRKEFDIAFERDTRNGSAPYITENYFSCMYCDRNSPFVFYSGSYKAYLEEYSTLVDMEKMLAKAMTNPLKTAVKFGIHG